MQLEGGAGVVKGVDMAVKGVDMGGDDSAADRRS